MNILLVSATQKEMVNSDRLSDMPGFSVCRLVTGVGQVPAAWALTNYLGNNKVDMVINIGIAGSFRKKYKPGDVIIAATDCFADMGVEEVKGFSDMWDAGLADPDQHPFVKGRLCCDPGLLRKLEGDFQADSAVTVIKASGSDATVSMLTRKYNPGIETMEGAAVYYTCAMEHVPVIGMRAVSNYVEARNRSSWKIEEALASLKNAVDAILAKME